jgi:hypothetical protein
MMKRQFSQQRGGWEEEVSGGIAGENTYACQAQRRDISDNPQRLQTNAS